jgi:hypothetical protein
MIIRAFNLEYEVRKSEDNRVREFVISTERPDSHGTVIKMDGWDIDDYNLAGAFYYQHQTGSPNPQNALGIGKSYKDANRLIGVAQFEPAEINPLAQEILNKVDYGTYKRTSVGFIPKKGKARWGDEKRGEDPELYYFEGQTLVEFSIVDIGSNLDAYKKSMESMDNYLRSVKEEHKSKGFQKDLDVILKNNKKRLEYIYSLMDRMNF